MENKSIMLDEFKKGDIVKVLPSVIPDYARYIGQCGTFTVYNVYYHVKFKTGIAFLLKHEFERVRYDWGDGED